MCHKPFDYNELCPFQARVCFPPPRLCSATNYRLTRRRAFRSGFQRPVLKGATTAPSEPGGPAETVSSSGFEAAYLPRVKITEVPPEPSVIEVTVTRFGADFFFLPV